MTTPYDVTDEFRCPQCGELFQSSLEDMNQEGVIRHGDHPDVFRMRAADHAFARDPIALFMQQIGEWLERIHPEEDE